MYTLYIDTLTPGNNIVASLPGSFALMTQGMFHLRTPLGFDHREIEGYSESVRLNGDMKHDTQAELGYDSTVRLMYETGVLTD